MTKLNCVIELCNYPPPFSEKDFEKAKKRIQKNMG